MMIYAGEVVLAKKYQIIKKIIIIKKSICCQTCCSLAHWPAPHWKWLLANIKSNSPLQDTVAEFSFTSCYPASEKCNSIRDVENLIILKIFFKPMQVICGRQPITLYKRISASRSSFSSLSNRSHAFFPNSFHIFFFVASQVYPTAASFTLASPNSTLGLLILRVPLVRGACVDM